MMTFTEAVRRIERAQTFRDLGGESARTYRELVKLVRRREPATPATDIHLAAGLLRGLIRRPVLRRFADGCRYDNPRMRPPDARSLLAKFDEL
jgi:hypothetical protein